ncbi:MAG: hypothetical protein DRH12_16830 [Deltaproteobacteria bacterium]|nr:MAG: hypothetical protein DRH12_16830 [Deltaproteobacteria bacterium]
MEFRKRGWCLLLLLIASIGVISLGTRSVAEEIPGFSKNKLSFWGTLRFRYENQDNFNIKSYGQNPVAGRVDDAFTIGRLRAGFRYRPMNDLIISVGIQHALVWGLALEEKDFYNPKFDRENNPYKDEWESFDTYIELKNMFSQPLSIKAGRQLIYYGDKRIFGPGQWGNSGKWMWDAVKIHYKWEQGFVDSYYGRSIIHDPDVFTLSHRHGYESLGFYSHLAIPVQKLSFVVEPFAMTKKDKHDRYSGEDGKTGDLSTYYLGVRGVIKDLKGINLDFTYVIQKGEYGSDDVDAFGYHFLLGYRAAFFPLRPYIYTEYSYGSGDSDPKDGEHGTFDGAFGARDKMYGRMNLFKWMNIKDAQINLELSLLKQIHIKLEYHKFWLAEEKDAWYLNPKAYRDKSGESGDEVGREFDVVVKYKLPAGNELQAGYGHFWPSEFARNVASDDEANWFFIQWQIKYSKGIL